MEMELLKIKKFVYRTYMMVHMPLVDCVHTQFLLSTDMWTPYLIVFGLAIPECLHTNI